MAYTKSYLDRLEKQVNSCRCEKCKGARRRSKSSSLERILVNKVLLDFPKVIREKKFGKYFVDAYIPHPYHIAFEADGDYWHKTPSAKAHDKKRDRYLLDKFNLVVIRLSENDLKEIDAYV